jgi:hypothetical protein
MFRYFYGEAIQWQQVKRNYKKECKPQRAQSTQRMEDRDENFAFFANFAVDILLNLLTLGGNPAKVFQRALSGADENVCRDVDDKYRKLPTACHG